MDPLLGRVASVSGDVEYSRCHREEALRFDIQCSGKITSPCSSYCVTAALGSIDNDTISLHNTYMTHELTCVSRSLPLYSYI